MPRGVYDRSHLKTKKAATPASTPAPVVKAAKVAPLKAVKTVSKKVQKAVSGSGFTAYAEPVPSTLPHDLYHHLASLTQSRGTIAATQVGHNQQLIDAFDKELADTIKSLRIWREARFPTSAPVKVEVEQVVKTSAPVVAAPAPAPIQAAPAAPPAPAQSAPPLPFTPATAAEVMKTAGA